MFWEVLLNPAAGSRSVPPLRVERALEAAGVEYRLQTPRGIDDMRAAVAGAAEAGVGQLAVVGGDGTVNLVANVLMDFPPTSRPLLGVLPGGTGCDLLRTFALPQKLEEAAFHLTRDDSTYPVDVGVLEGGFGRRYFVNVAQTGVGAAAVETAGGMSRRWGRARYPLAFLARLPGFRKGTVRIELPDRVHEGPALAVIFANGQFFAGGWNVAPRATVMDGRLDLQIVNTSKWDAPRLVPKIIRGLHLSDRALRRMAPTGFTVTTDDPWPIEADGELVGNTPVTVRVEAGALSLKI
jgi:diacylglycerol kinase (ATP)